MKLTFKRLCCMGMAVLFSLNLANVSLSVKAEGEPLSVVEKGIVVKQGQLKEDLVIPEEKAQEIIDQYLKNTKKSDKSALIATYLSLIGGHLGLDDIYLGNFFLGFFFLSLRCYFGTLFVLDEYALIFNLAMAVWTVSGERRDCNNLRVQF